MAPNKRAQQNHDALFPNHVSTLATTDPELITNDVLTDRRRDPAPAVHRLPAHTERAACNRRGRASRSAKRMKVLVVGATGSIGHLAVEEAIRQRHTVRALVRDKKKARQLPAGTDLVVGDLTHVETLAAAVDGVDAIVFTHGSDGGGKAGAERIDYGGVRSVLAALGGRTVRVALMTAIGVTNREGDYNRRTEAHDWKRRGERLVRASGLPYTIVRPGWFDDNKPDEHRPRTPAG
jgi:NADPH:quinone reductase-like Zn-dependent oxidoreductase